MTAWSWTAAEREGQRALGLLIRLATAAGLGGAFFAATGTSPAFLCHLDITANYLNSHDIT